jgi:ABC-2 type transport system permease protein/oleandomycin transport system permease protein
MSTATTLGAMARDTLAMTRRNLYHYLRLPALLAVAMSQAVLFVVMFTYVFQGAIHTPGIRYVDYLMPGILILAVAFGSPNTGVGLAEDLTTGMLDRFRSLPMARPALLAGRTLADAVRNLLVVLVMLAVGHLIGFRFHAGPFAALAAIALPVAFGYVLSWFAALVGLAAGDAETAGTASLLPIIPLAFTSSTFVPIDTMPGPLRAWAGINPITHIVDADRALILGGPTTTPVLQALAWLTALAALTIPLALHRYQRATR